MPTTLSTHKLNRVTRASLCDPNQRIADNTRAAIVELIRDSEGALSGGKVRSAYNLAIDAYNLLFVGI